GAGAHPCLMAGTQLIDECALTVPAAARLLVDDRQIPVGRAPVDGSAFDFRRARRIGHTQLDTAFTDLQRAGDGLAWAVLEGPSRTVRMWVDATHSYLMVFTGDTLPPGRQRRGLAIEPMTCAPNALQSGDGLRTLQPGETFASEWGIVVQD
ncbi:MAG: aldose epimerase, partial [Candidatus Dormibacteraeota bacterium]|nr:aldose epimerase [Candidatus Dormibacteraeota bacterium]